MMAMPLCDESVRISFFAPAHSAYVCDEGKYQYVHTHAVKMLCEEWKKYFKTTTNEHPFSLSLSLSLWRLLFAHGKTKKNGQLAENNAEYYFLLVSRRQKAHALFEWTDYACVCRRRHPNPVCHCYSPFGSWFSFVVFLSIFPPK